MKILHIVSLVDPGGSFGGPLRVAVDQLTALREEGHEVLLAAGWRDYSERPAQFDGVRLEAFRSRALVPGTGFAGLAAPGMLAWLARHARRFDVVHVHLARDLVSLPAAGLLMALGIPFVTQTHGMIDASERRSAGLLDAALTRRVLRAARSVLALHEGEAADLEEVTGAQAKIRLLRNGVPDAGRAAAPAESADVLFLARLAARKRPLAFVRMAQQLAPRFPQATFSIVGPDEGELEAVTSALAEDDADGRIRYEGALAPSRTRERMSRSAVYVLPAVDEPFGMTVVEAMSVGLPAVVMRDCGLAGAVARSGGGTASSQDDLEDAVAALLADPARRAQVGRAGVDIVARSYGIAPVIRELTRVYARAGGAA